MIFSLNILRTKNFDKIVTLDPLNSFVYILTRFRFCNKSTTTYKFKQNLQICAAKSKILGGKQSQEDRAFTSNQNEYEAPSNTVTMQNKCINKTAKKTVAIQKIHKHFIKSMKIR